MKCASVNFRRAVCNLHSQNFACTLFEAQFVDRLTDADGSPSTIQDVLNKVKRMIGWNTEVGSIEREEEGGREGGEGGREGGAGGEGRRRGWQMKWVAAAETERVIKKDREIKPETDKR
jgi:hypothetical protein